jgi:hypothetical protein
MCNFVVEVGEEEAEDDVENPSAVGLLPSISRDKTDESPADERRYFMVLRNALVVQEQMSQSFCQSKAQRLK